MKKFTMMAALLIAGSMMTVSAQGNLLKNAGFEEGGDMDGFPIAWELYGSRQYGTATIVEEGAKEGTKCLQIAVAEGRFNKKCSIIQYSETFTIDYSKITEPNKVATKASFWYKVVESQGSNSRFYMAFQPIIDSNKDGASTYALLNAQELSVGDWIYFEKDTTATYAAGNGQYENIPAQISFILNAADCTVLIDEVNIEIEGVKGQVSGIENTSSSRLNLHTDGNTLQVAGVKAGEQVSIYTTTGVALATQSAQGDIAYFESLPQGQVLIVKCGEAVSKVIL